MPASTLSTRLNKLLLTVDQIEERASQALAWLINDYAASWIEWAHCHDAMADLVDLRNASTLSSAIDGLRSNASVIAKTADAGALAIATKMGLVDPTESLRIANERIAETLDAKFPVYLLTGSRSDVSSIWQLAEIVKHGNSPISSQPGHTVSLYLIGELVQHCVLFRLRTHSEAALHGLLAGSLTDVEMNDSLPLPSTEFFRTVGMRARAAIAVIAPELFSEQ